MAWALQKSPARAVAVVVVAAAAAAAVGAMRVQPPPLMDVCIKHKWFEMIAPGKLSPPTAGTTDPKYLYPRPSVTSIPWDVVRKLALEQGTELGLGDSLPVLACFSFPSPCPASLSSYQANFTRVAKRGACVVVNGVCKTLLVTVKEPTSCYCGKQGILGEIRNVSLLDHASGGVCMALRMDTQGPSSCCCGKKKEMSRRTYESPIGLVGLVGNTCPTDFAARPEEKNYREQSKEASGLNELPEKQVKEGGKRVESGVGGGSLVQPTETQIRDDKDGEGTEEDSGGLSELTEERLKEDSVIEDVVAALVFLFVGAVLMLIKNRVFKFTKKKRQQEEKDVESEETLVDETGI